MRDDEVERVECDLARSLSTADAAREWDANTRHPAREMVELSDAELEGVAAGLGKTPPAVAKDPPQSFPRWRPLQALVASTQRATGCVGGTCPA